MRLFSTFLAPCVLLAGTVAAEAQYRTDYYTARRPTYSQYQYPQRRDTHRYSTDVHHQTRPNQTRWIPVYRFFHPQSGDQLLSVNPRAEDQYSLSTFVDDGMFLISPDAGPGKIPLIRFYEASGMHSFATSREHVPYGTVEGVLGYIEARQIPGSIPLYGYYDPYRERHVVTTDARSSLRQSMEYEGILGYVMPAHSY